MLTEEGSKCALVRVADQKERICTFINSSWMLNVFKIAHCGCEFCSDADLHMTALTLELCCTMMIDKKHHANAGAAIRERVLPQALILVKSSLLQGQALQVDF